MLLWVVIREEMHYPGMTTDQLAGIKQFISGRERIIHSEQLLGFALQRIQVWLVFSYLGQMWRFLLWRQRPCFQIHSPYLHTPHILLNYTHHAHNVLSELPDSKKSPKKTLPSKIISKNTQNVDSDSCILYFWSMSLLRHILRNQFKNSSEKCQQMVETPKKLNPMFSFSNIWAYGVPMRCYSRYVWSPDSFEVVYTLSTATEWFPHWHDWEKLTVPGTQPDPIHSWAHQNSASFPLPHSPR